MHCRSITAEFLIPPIVHVVKVMILFHTKSTEGGGGEFTWTPLFSQPPDKCRCFIKCLVFREGFLNLLDCSYRMDSVLFVDIEAQSHRCGIAGEKMKKSKWFLLVALGYFVIAQGGTCHHALENITNLVMRINKFKPKIVLLGRINVT